MLKQQIEVVRSWSELRNIPIFGGSLRHFVPLCSIRHNQNAMLLLNRLITSNYGICSSCDISYMLIYQHINYATI